MNPLDQDILERLSYITDEASEIWGKKIDLQDVFNIINYSIANNISVKNAIISLK